jgi:hypothetical protein
MLKAIAKVSNWHRYLLSFLIALDAVCVAISTGAVKTPDTIHDVAPWAAIANIFLVAFLPRFQLPTGAGAPPILSPPVKDTPVPTPTLVDGHLTSGTSGSHPEVTWSDRTKVPPRG